MSVAYYVLSRLTALILIGAILYVDLPTYEDEKHQITYIIRAGIVAAFALIPGGLEFVAGMILAIAVCYKLGVAKIEFVAYDPETQKLSSVDSEEVP